jgi:glycerol-3-phosphate dehydrogenase
LTLYDFLAGRGNLRRSRVLSIADLHRAIPCLKPDQLVGGASYFDAQMEDARLCVEVIRTATEHGARVANYVEAVAFESGVVRVLDRVSGRELLIRARQLVNATGPWVDAVCKLAGDDSGPHLQPTKGVHLVVRDMGLSSAFLLLHPRDGRVFFVIPWLGKTLLGTTDTHYTGSPDTVTATSEDVAYLLEGYAHHFAPPLTSADVLSAFAGLRPLLRSKPGEPSSLSREHALFWSKSGMLSVAGGKYTTYRAMAEEIVDAVAKRLGCRVKSRTREVRLDGAPDMPWGQFLRAETERLRRRGLEESAARHLVQRYGQRAGEVAAYAQTDPALAHPIVDGEPDLEAELAYQRDHEMALSRADSLLRRTRLGLFRPELLR